MSQKWSRSETIGLLSLIVAVVTIVVSLYIWRNPVTPSANENTQNVLATPASAPTVLATFSPISDSSTVDCTAPEGLVVIATGIWGSRNMQNFLVGTIEIDTHHSSFGPFEMWIDPCLAETSGSTIGRSFWPDGRAANCSTEYFSDIPAGGERATTINLCSGTGVWGLGPPHQEH